MSVSQTFMDQALEQARLAAQRGEVPVGAVLVHEGKIISQSGNQTLELHDPTAHAEITTIRDACALLKSQRLPNCDLYVTLEPCPMCASAIAHARIRRLYFGAEDVKGGAVVNGVKLYSQATCHHRPEIYSGIGEQQAAEYLKSFFADKRHPTGE